MKKMFVLALVLILTFVLCGGCVAIAEAEPAAPMFTVNITQLVIAVMGVLFNVMLAWLIKAVIPPAKKWLNEHTSALQQQRAWTMIKWLVEAAEQTITGYAKGSERLKWVLAELQARGIEADAALIEAAVKEMKDNAYKEIRQVIVDEDECDECKIDLEDDLK